MDLSRNLMRFPAVANLLAAHWRGRQVSAPFENVPLATALTDRKHLRQGSFFYEKGAQHRRQSHSRLAYEYNSQRLPKAAHSSVLLILVQGTDQADIMTCLRMTK